MKLYFIRHGQTDWNLEGRIQGSYDSELNETGILQAEELSRKIVKSGYKFTRIYSSRQKRAMMTAQILSEATHAALIPTDGLEEINLGQWEGLLWHEVKERFPIEYEAWRQNRRTVRTPGGESYQDVLDRVLAAIRTIIDGNRENVAIVTHGAIMMSLQCVLSNTSFDNLLKFKTENASVVEMDSELFR